MQTPPLLSTFRKRLMRRVQVAQIIRKGKRRFSKDRRFDLRAVEQGLAPRPGEAADDAVLLRRICDAWSNTMAQQESAPEAFQPHRWWRARRDADLGPIIRALATYDFDSMRKAYGNFFRDRCSAGLTGMPLATVEAGTPVSYRSKQLLLIDALHRVDVWKNRTKSRFPLADLTPPSVGNPFGVVIDSVFIRNGSEDQHYCAHRMIDLHRSPEPPVVAEIGGGFGGMAYYLIRDCPGVTYLNFDLPETIALASYYLLSAFPEAKAVLYGEAELGSETMQSGEIILMPGFAIAQVPPDSVDVAFNSRILSDLTPASLRRYLEEIARTTRGSLLHLNRSEGSIAADRWFAANAPDFKLVENRISEWNDAKTLKPDEREYVYRRERS